MVASARPAVTAARRHAAAGLGSVHAPARPWPGLSPARSGPGPPCFPGEFRPGSKSAARPQPHPGRRKDRPSSSRRPARPATDAARLGNPGCARGSPPPALSPRQRRPVCRPSRNRRACRCRAAPPLRGRAACTRVAVTRRYSACLRQSGSAAPTDGAKKLRK
jgi:hypothetical protein